MFRNVHPRLMPHVSDCLIKLSLMVITLQVKKMKRTIGYGNDWLSDNAVDTTYKQVIDTKFIS